MDINPLAISNEEMFAFNIKSGMSKTEAYRAVVDCTELKDKSVNVLAWRYSNKPLVVKFMSEDYDNMFSEFASKRIEVIRNLHHLSLNAESEFVQQSSSTAFLNAIAKATKLEVVHNVDNTLVDALAELRGIMNVETPHSIPVMNKKHKSNSNLISEKDSESILKENVITLDGEVVDKELFDEQTKGINPSYSKGTTKKDINTTGAFRESETGRFISNDKVEEMLGFKDA